MKTTKLLSFIAAGALALWGFTACSGERAAGPIPKVTGPIQATADSFPFNAASRSIVPQDLSQSGYVEEEYLVDGTANVYNRDSQGKVVIKTPHVPYTTRILVRRPATSQGFSGTVVVELLDWGMKCDLDTQWQLSGSYFMEQKDIWVGITSKPIAARALRTFDPVRYGSISWGPENENGLVWDITTQVGVLLKSSSSHNPLKTFPVKRVYLTAYSQTAGYLVTYINFIRPLNGGKPIYDGYLIGDGDGMPAALNQSSASVNPKDPLFLIQPRSEPVVSVVSQTLLSVNNLARRPDSDSPGDRYRRYEVPGAALVNQRMVQLGVKPEDAKKAGVEVSPPNCKEIATYGLTDFPLQYFVNAAFANLDAWVRSGTLPPKTGFIAVESDRYGNRLGGLRSPYVEVPVATYHESSTPNDLVSAFLCPVEGYKVPLGKDVLATLYPTHEAYVKKVADSVDGLVKERLLTKTDGEKIKKEAEGATVP